ncbi:MAG: hypothetical protein NTV49_02475, partial [Kiritimatiellaeota bacterium]|nr:hypothetical protein [Kiritimatiellota bacterium]
PLSILAQVRATSGTIKSVTLAYTLSKDAAPFKLPMQATGAQTYLGTIPAGLMTNADKLWYYLEATDSLDAATETPWYVVSIQNSPALAAASGAGVVAAPGPEQATGRSSLLGAGLVAGGAAAVVGAALLVANRGGGSDSGTAATNTSGRYVGSKTICLTMLGAPQQCASTPTAIIIDQQGAVSSDSLLPGQFLSGQLSGSSFALSGSSSTSNLVSQLQFSGSVVGQRLVGSITGTAQSATNQGAYSGAFTADKQ